MRHSVGFIHILILYCKFCYIYSFSPQREIHLPSWRSINFGVVDTHVHLMNTRNNITYTWAKEPSKLVPPESCPCRPPCSCNMSFAEYELASAFAPVDYFVFCEVAAAPEDFLREAKWVQSLGWLISIFYVSCI